MLLHLHLHLRRRATRTRVSVLITRIVAHLRHTAMTTVEGITFAARLQDLLLLNATTSATTTQIAAHHRLTTMTEDRHRLVMTTGATTTGVRRRLSATHTSVSVSITRSVARLLHNATRIEDMMIGGSTMGVAEEEEEVIAAEAAAIMTASTRERLHPPGWPHPLAAAVPPA